MKSSTFCRARFRSNGVLERCRSAPGPCAGNACPAPTVRTRGRGFHAIEVRDGLRHAVLEHLEIVAGETTNGIAAAVRHRHVDIDDRDFDLSTYGGACAASGRVARMIAAEQKAARMAPPL